MTKQKKKGWEKRFETLWKEGNYGYNNIGENTMRNFIAQELKDQREEIITTLHYIWTNIPLTGGMMARKRMRELIDKLTKEDE